MSEHSEGNSNRYLSVKPFAVAGATFALTTPPLVYDGRLSLTDIITIICAMVGSVSALYMRTPGTGNSTNG